MEEAMTKWEAERDAEDAEAEANDPELPNLEDMTEA